MELPLSAQSEDGSRQRRPPLTHTRAKCVFQALLVLTMAFIFILVLPYITLSMQQHNGLRQPRGIQRLNGKCASSMPPRTFLAEVATLRQKPVPLLMPRLYVEEHVVERMRGRWIERKLRLPQLPLLLCLSMDISQMTKLPSSQRSPRTMKKGGQHHSR